MLKYSIGVRLSWEISSYEASNKQASFIEIDHIMLGILSLDKISSNLKNLAETDLDNFLYEKDKLYTILLKYNIRVTSFRRKLRQLIPFGEEVPTDNVFHRSQECKKMFSSSSQFAANYITINHLFISIIGIENSYSRNLLLAMKVDLEKIKTDLLFSFYKNN
ncbi:MAG: Clp protease N-terminal domain-containing protein [Candidatus Paceibacterota bacterium]